MKTRSTALIVIALIASSLVSATTAAAAPSDLPNRNVEAIVLTGAQLPGWSGPAADGFAKPYPNGASEDPPYPEKIGERDAHAGTLITPPAEAWSDINPDEVVAYSMVEGAWKEIPVQVDERFPYFLANPNSGFGFYSGTDKELTYEWDVESWKKTAGQCLAQYPEGESAMEDPVLTLDNDDEIVFMASDAGAQATGAPEGITGPRQEITITDPLSPTAERYVYLFTRPGGSTFSGENGYVSYARDADADDWIDQGSFADSDPEKLGSSNTGYGPNISGTVCDFARDPDTGDYVVDPDTGERIFTQVRNASDRFPRDGVTVTTDTYAWRATGRWMVRNIHITKPDTMREYGRDLVDRWKGRAFQQAPDSAISVVGFEDEQVNWEANSALLGEITGPVRAIREIWGADSGTNVTKTETFYRDAITYRYRVRVHPIPPDGLYTSWDYNHDAVSTYYNETKTDGVTIDGQNDDIGHVDEGPTGPAYFDAADPTFTKPTSFLNWEQVSGNEDNGSLVYMFEMKNANSLVNPLVVPYYRDDACLDDGTGDNPSPRPWPGEAQTDSRLAEYRTRPCYGDPSLGSQYSNTADPAIGYKQGCFGCHGIHYFVTGDTDNAMAPVPVTEIDGQQWQWMVPTAAPANVGDAYANTVKVPLIATATSL